MDLNKITKGLTYLAATRSLPPHVSNKQLPPIKPPPKPPKDRLTKTNARWANIRALRTARRVETEAINEAIKEAIEEAIMDSGSTSHFFQNGKGMKLTGPSSKQVSAANGGIMQASNTAELPLTALKPSAKQAVIVPKLKSKALLSVGKFFRCRIYYNFPSS